jgi:hypothetical protein
MKPCQLLVRVGYDLHALSGALPWVQPALLACAAFASVSSFAFGGLGHSLDVTLREHRPLFKPMTGSLGTTPSIHNQLDSVTLHVLSASVTLQAACCCTCARCR